MIWPHSRLPDGSDAEANFARRAANQSIGGINRQNQVSGVRVNRTTRGDVVIPDASASGGTSGAIAKPYHLKAVQGDYVTARTWDAKRGIEGSSDVLLAKEYSIRNSVTDETVVGVPRTYSYEDGPDSLNVYRVHDDGTNSQVEIVTPPFRVDEIIYGIRSLTGVTDGDGNTIGLLMIRSCQWGKPSPLAFEPATPASADDTTNGYDAGLIVADANFIYVSVAQDTWKRAALSTW
jgi:hypothetical protein